MNNALIRDYLPFLLNLSAINLSDDEQKRTFDEITEDLRFYSTYGLYDIIIPFLEAAHILGNENAAKIIDKKVQSFSDAGFIFSTLVNYHREMIDSYNICRKISSTPEPETEIWKRAIDHSEAQVERFVWDSYDMTQISEIADNRKRNLGLWIPALYAKDVNKKFFQRLSRDFVNALKEAIDERRKNLGIKCWPGLLRDSFRNCWEN